MLQWAMRSDLLALEETRCPGGSASISVGIPRDAFIYRVHYGVPKRALGIGG